MASAILITTSRELADKVSEEVEAFTKQLSREEIIRKSLDHYGYILIAQNMDQAIDAVNEIASEHLEILTKNPYETMTKVKNAGAIFLGEYSSEPLGDYFAGPNHILPTKSEISTGIGFFDHMLEGFSRHGFFDLDVKVTGDLHVDGHHTVEDTGIVLGTAIKEALGDKKSIKRFGSCILPMDDALCLCAVDLGGRPYFKMDAQITAPMVGNFDTELVREFFYAVSYTAGMNLHIRMLDGVNAHHIIEAMFKSFAKALDEATKKDERITDVLSTKGSL